MDVFTIYRRFITSAKDDFKKICKTKNTILG